jgi:hypothetical protein
LRLVGRLRRLIRAGHLGKSLPYPGASCME